MTTLLFLLILLILNALLIRGIWVSAYFEDENEYITDNDTGLTTCLPAPRNKMALWWLKYYGDKWLPKWLQKPLYDCPTCMASIHSTYVYWYFISFTWSNLALYPAYILCLAGLNSILNNIGND